MSLKTRIAGTLFILFVIGLNQILDAQQQKNSSKDSLNYFKYPNEMNMSLPIFGRPSAFMYKVRLPEINYVTYNRKNAARFQFGFALTHAMKNDSIFPDDYLTVYWFQQDLLTYPAFGNYSNAKSMFSGFAEVGFEQQRQLERFHLFYGADLGIYITSNNYFDFLSIVHDSTGEHVYSYYDIKENYIGPAITPFAGFKFFITQRISAGIESGIRFGLFWRNLSHTYYDEYTDTETENNNKITYFDINTKYIRSISMSFYF